MHHTLIRRPLWWLLLLLLRGFIKASLYISGVGPVGAFLSSWINIFISRVVCLTDRLTVCLLQRCCTRPLRAVVVAAAAPPSRCGWSFVIELFPWCGCCNACNGPEFGNCRRKLRNSYLHFFIFSFNSRCAGVSFFNLLKIGGTNGCEIDGNRCG